MKWHNVLVSSLSVILKPFLKEYLIKCLSSIVYKVKFKNVVLLLYLFIYSYMNSIDYSLFLYKKNFIKIPINCISPTAFDFSGLNSAVGPSLLGLLRLPEYT